MGLPNFAIIKGKGIREKKLNKKRSKFGKIGQNQENLVAIPLNTFIRPFP
jgi:hypothetical protein